MKLLRCHVDNFGKLSNYDYSFVDGLNVIQEHNGFGKSTLAAFIKAMFYGFPRIGKRSITENERKKYSPWQGGSYGGSLDFEFEGISYRVRRTFGDKASKDTYSLRDLKNHRESSRFSENLGEELFQLDAESFMRSVYMSQGRETDTLATTSMQTKLSNLVNNTDDLNNYDVAIDRLRKERSKYQKLRGSGGIIDDIQDDICKLAKELFEAENKKPLLIEATKDVEKLSEQTLEQDKELALLHDKITKASKQKGDKVIREQFIELEKDLTLTEENIDNLNKLYPKGYPKKEEIAFNNKRVLAIEHAEKSLSELVIKDEDIECEAKWREVFADEETTSNDIRLCQNKCDKLVEVTTQATIQMSEDELTELESLKKLFEEGIPTEQEMKDYQDKIDLLSVKRGECSAIQLGEEENEQLSKLERFFDKKTVDEDELKHCEEIQEETKIFENKLQDMVLSDEEQKDWNYLRRVFSIEVPQDNTIFQKQNDCRRIDELNSKKNTKTMVFQSNQTSSVQKQKSSIGLIVLGALLLLLGVFGFVSNIIAMGAVFTIIGFVVLLIYFWIHTKQMVNQSSGQVAVESSAISEEEIQELYNLQKNLKEFISKFYDDNSDLNAKLTKLILDKQNYLQLKDKKEDIESRANTLCGKVEENQKILLSVFNRYYPNSNYQDSFVSELRENWAHYKNLSNRQNSLHATRTGLIKELDNLEKELREAFTKYYNTIDSKEFSTILSNLKADVQAFETLDQKYNKTKSSRAEAERERFELINSIEHILKKYNIYFENESYTDSIENLRTLFSDYKRASKNVMDLQNRKKELEEQKTNAKEGLEQFAKDYGLSIPISEEVLSKISDDIISYEQQLQDKVELLKKLEHFKTQHPEYKDGLPQEEFGQEELPSTEILIEEEKNTKGKQRVTNEELQAARNKRKELLNKIEQIPDMEDQIKRLKIERKNAENSRDILDKTLSLLEMAKSNLSTQYVGSVEQNFSKYMQELMGNDFKNAMVDHDLKIQVDEKGEAREIGYFSAGMADCMMLCMRLALIDALFKQEEPFIILDDPFVNLDDTHTSYALEMLKKIAQDKQIIYMVCNSSRT
ncbi:AAA family ATPase [Lachnoanaerobaculum saburreum]|uniref:Putative ATP synthase F1, epsilon subunit n=1 Tax=Lachnoanaerobaculum saburreum DSM 3986 TaxID=887325 RepID=E6LMQ7_9FIRM|nr:AAA family ATPase [Lachnoanaerobaculum saburreum]EFU76866.1 putative ATP synthase F1, epsilon subunit [Lachnoanaerobaculum saburreum DSM 3986]